MPKTANFRDGRSCAQLCLTLQLDVQFEPHFNGSNCRIEYKDCSIWLCYGLLAEKRKFENLGSKILETGVPSSDILR